MTIPSMSKLSTVFPIMIEKYEQFIPNIEGMGVPDKINAIIQYLNRIGKLSNDVVADWNKVMVWVMDEGLTDAVISKVDDLIAKGTFDTLLNGMFDDVNNANTAFQTTVNSTLTSLPIENYIKSANQIFNPAPHGLRLKKYGVILDKGSTGAWDQALVESPCVWFDKKKQKYAMVYTGYSGTPGSPVTGSIGLAWSDKPEGPWTKEALNPIITASGLTGTPDAGGMTGPVMWYENGTYYLFYIGLGGSGYENTTALCLATSTDLYTWVRKGAVISIDASKSWRSLDVYHASIVKVKDVYYMFFNTKTSDNKEVIGLATSNDLLTWVVDDAHSPLVSGTVGQWDETKTGDPSVYYVDGIWYMAYFGYSFPTGVASDGVAWTTKEEFPYNWRKYNANPILSPSESFDIKFAHKPYIFINGNRHYHYYTAEADTTGSNRYRTIALATDDFTGSVIKLPNIISYRCGESTRSYTTYTGTNYTGVTDTTCLINVDNKLNVKVRFTARVNVTIGSLILASASENIYSPESQVTIPVTSGWINVTSAWFPLRTGGTINGINRYNLGAYIGASGNSASIGNVQFEITWD
jgi:predicted GH43/DUF377 family glycosyl hydrolase